MPLHLLLIQIGVIWHHAICTLHIRIMVHGVRTFLAGWNRPAQTSLAVCDARSVPESDLVVMPAVVAPKGSSPYESVPAGGRFDTWSIEANLDYHMINA